MRLAQRLADQGALAPDWSIADAAMVYWAVTSEEVHKALTSLGMDHDEYMAAISKLLHLGLLDPSSR